MNAMTVVVGASFVTAFAVGLGILFGVRNTRSTAKSMVGRGEGVLTVARRTRLAQDVVAVLAYRAPANERRSGQNMPRAALSAAAGNSRTLARPVG